ncbi:MAG: epoxyqueuosine reductase [Pelotomaculum sp.]|nr:epoxyqueuosine reductase [Pelotomaculum sp.]
MNKEDLIKAAVDFIENSEDNYITRQVAISENVAGVKIFEKPVFAFGAADDEYFSIMKQPSVIGKHFLLPNEWLPQAKTVISFFLPFSEAVKKGNRKDLRWPSEEWLYGRIEGQVLVNKLCSHLQSVLTNAGYNSLVPGLDKRFRTDTKTSFTSNWSERHVAFICGLGTFGLSKGLITPKGMAGRLGSILTELYLPPDKREYEDIYEFCSMCGKCAKNCPVKAISVENGKDHAICSNFLDVTAEKFKPRYGCGKCQVDVPCESKIPKTDKG